MGIAVAHPRLRWAKMKGPYGVHRGSAAGARLKVNTHSRLLHIELVVRLDDTERDTGALLRLAEVLGRDALLEAVYALEALDEGPQPRTFID